MARCLVTGGAGFVGSHLVERLLADEQDVTVLDNLSSGLRENLAHLAASPRFRFLEGDVNDTAVLNPLVFEADTVYHLAATVGVFSVLASPAATIANNVHGTQAVLEAAVPRKTKVIVTSTSEVYGKNAKVPFQEEDDLVLGATTKSRWGYAASKIMDEFLALAYWRQYQVPAVVVRLFNTIGARQSGEHGMVVPRLVRQAILGQNLTVFGTGRQSRSFTDVSDVIEWLVRLAGNQEAVGQIVNLGNTEEITIEELAARIIAVTGSRSEIEFVPYDQAYGEGFAEIDRRVPDNSKVIRLTGHRPAVTLEEMLARVCASCLQGLPA